MKQMNSVNVQGNQEPTYRNDLYSIFKQTPLRLFLSDLDKKWLLCSFRLDG